MALGCVTAKLISTCSQCHITFIRISNPDISPSYKYQTDVLPAELLWGSVTLHAHSLVFHLHSLVFSRQECHDVSFFLAAIMTLSHQGSHWLGVDRGIGQNLFIGTQSGMMQISNSRELRPCKTADIGIYFTTHPCREIR